MVEPLAKAYARYRICLTDQANRDIQMAMEWIAAESPGNAARWTERCVRAIESLERYPLRHPRAREGRIFGEQVRQAVVDRYRIIFCVRGRGVFVLHIRHSARMPWDGRSDEGSRSMEPS